MEAIDLLQQCFIYDPAKRITASEALNHSYFHVRFSFSSYVQY